MPFTLKDIQEIINQENKLQSRKDVYRKEAVAQINNLIAAFGLKAEDLDFNAVFTVRPERPARTTTAGKGRGKKKAKANRPKVKRQIKPKYRAPDGTTWTGRGKMPVALKNLVDRGVSLDSMLIKDDAAPQAES